MKLQPACKRSGVNSLRNAWRSSSPSAGGTHRYDDNKCHASRGVFGEESLARSLRCHCEPTGPAFGRPDDRLREAISPRSAAVPVAEIASSRKRAPRNDSTSRRHERYLKLTRSVRLSVEARSFNGSLSALALF